MNVNAVERLKWRKYSWFKQWVRQLPSRTPLFCFMSVCSRLCECVYVLLGVDWHHAGVCLTQPSRVSDWHQAPTRIKRLVKTNKWIIIYFLLLIWNPQGSDPVVSESCSVPFSPYFCLARRLSLLFSWASGKLGLVPLSLSHSLN